MSKETVNPLTGEVVNSFCREEYRSRLRESFIYSEWQKNEKGGYTIGLCGRRISFFYKINPSWSYYPSGWNWVCDGEFGQVCAYLEKCREMAFDRFFR